VRGMCWGKAGPSRRRSLVRGATIVRVYFGLASGIGPTSRVRNVLQESPLVKLPGGQGAPLIFGSAAGVSLWIASQRLPDPT
jgi:hypothetical protein